MKATLDFFECRKFSQGKKEFINFLECRKDAIFFGRFHGNILNVEKNQHLF